MTQRASRRGRYSVTLCVMTWRRSVTGSVAFSLNMLAVTLWLVGHTAEVMATSEALIAYSLSGPCCSVLPSEPVSLKRVSGSV
ncbi:hypothetical protein C8039_11015 [Halogeometricum sp. wsp3]|nr:hypothetical protein C8039_11015 [Halogeometricum sp. wsp3]